MRGKLINLNIKETFITLIFIKLIGIMNHLLLLDTSIESRHIVLENELNLQIIEKIEALAIQLATIEKEIVNFKEQLNQNNRRPAQRNFSSSYHKNGNSSNRTNSNYRSDSSFNKTTSSNNRSWTNKNRSYQDNKSSSKFEKYDK